MGTQTFAYTGAEQTFTVPAGVTSLHIDCYGAQGGRIGTTQEGGLGGRAAGWFPVAPGQVLRIYVGQQPTGGAGGYNGGGLGRVATNTGRGGGGASDVRTVSGDLSSRLIAAGGGGGACNTAGTGSNYGTAGAGGGPVGGSGSSANTATLGLGGTQAAGGAGGVGGASTGSPGALGVGGNNGATGSYPGGGGGGGWYGGGGGGSGTSAITGGPGGGGSNGPTAALTLDQQGVRTGSGQVILTWLTPPSAAPQALVAVGGASEVIVTTNDGINWTHRTSTLNGSVINYDVVWSPARGYFVAVGTNGNVAVSQDGISWDNLGNKLGGNQGNAIAWSPTLGLFVAGATGLWTSPDGIVWTQRASSLGAVTGVCWVPEMGKFFACSANNVDSSPDGITWTNLSTSGSSNRRITWIPERALFVMGGNGTNAVRTSPDGITWTSRLNAGIYGSLDFAWSPTLGLAVAASNDQTSNALIYTSNDLITWTVRTMKAGVASFTTFVEWLPSAALFVTSVGNQPPYTSPDGINWTARSSPYASQRQGAGIYTAPPLAPVAPATLPTSWKVRSVLTSAGLATAWNIRAALAAAAMVATAWTVDQTVAATADTAWNVTGGATSTVEASTSTTWRVAGEATNSVGTAWYTRALVEADVATTWLDRAGVEASTATTWATRKRVNRTTSTLWAIYERPFIVAEYFTVQIEMTPGTWTDITGSGHQLDIGRNDGEPGTLVYEVIDASLDPVTAPQINMGDGLRVRVKKGTGWAAIFTGTINDLQVETNPRADTGRQVTVRMSAIDNIAQLGNITEVRGVKTIPELGWLIGSQVPFNINGVTVPGTGAVVATNDNASLWDQILVTRDSALGYAWVDGDGVLRVYDAAALDKSVKAAITPAVYSDLDRDFALEDVINEVTVNWRRYNVGTEKSSDIPYGPYVDATSKAKWGPRSASLTIQGPAVEEDPANISAYASHILALSSTAAHRAKTATIPVTTAARLATVRDLDLNSVVSVTYQDTTTVATLRITGIRHSVTVRSGEGMFWQTGLDFAGVDGIAVPSQTPGTGVAYIPAGSIGTDELDPDLDDTITGAASEASDALSLANDAFNEASDATNSIAGWTYTGTTEIDGGKIRADTVTAVQINANAITAKHTLTGALIQTTAAPSRGIKLNGTGLIAYDASGNPTVSLSAADGSASFKGSIVSGSNITGANFQTASSGKHVAVGPAYGVDTVAFYDSAGTLRDTIVGGTGGGLSLLGNQGSGPVTVFGSLAVNGGASITGNLGVDGAIQADTLAGSGGPTYAVVGNSGVITRGAPVVANLDDRLETLTARIAALEAQLGGTP